MEEEQRSKQGEAALFRDAIICGREKAQDQVRGKENEKKK